MEPISGEEFVTIVHKLNAWLSRRYRIVETLGSGVYGTVFRAQETASGAMVAIKRPNVADVVQGQGMSVSMIREATLLRSFRSKKHDNILNLQDCFLRHGRIYLVFDYFYCNLRTHLQDLSSAGHFTIPLDQLHSYMQQILSALEYCHDQHVVHRDLKPDNILLDESKMRLVVCDFGMARTCAAAGKYTENCVTSWYRPPEIFLGDTQYGEAVDIWSAGMIMAEMINLIPIMNTAKTDMECLHFIFKALGTPNEFTWPGVTRLPNYQYNFAQYPARHASTLLFFDEVIPRVSDLLNCMLQVRPENRWTASDALRTHEYFAPDFMVRTATVETGNDSIDADTDKSVQGIFSAANDDLPVDCNEQHEALVSPSHIVLLNGSNQDLFQCPLSSSIPKARTGDIRELLDNESPCRFAYIESSLSPLIPAKRKREDVELLLCTEMISPQISASHSKILRARLLEDFPEAALMQIHQAFTQF